MGFKILLTVLLVAASVNAAPDQTREELPAPKSGEEVDWYDCSGKAIGNYQNPRDCSKYIACASGNRAFAMPCAACHVEAGRCPDGVLHYQEAEDRCWWVDEVQCDGGGGGSPTEEPTTQRITTTRSTTTPAPTDPLPTPPPRPIEGTDCVPDECVVSGWCHWYDWCERDDESGLGADHKGHGKDGEWKAHNCSADLNLYFNPEANDYGGSCDFWGNLDPKLKEAYNLDPDCIDPHCEWKVDPDNKVCAPTYLYFHPKRYGGKEVKLTCPKSDNDDQLLWDQDKKMCLHCEEVTDDHGNPCPC